MAAYCLAFFLFTAYFSQLFIPANQLTVHRGSSVLRPVPLPKNRFGFTMKHLDLQRGDQFTEGYLCLFVPGHKGNVKQAISMTRFFEKNGLLLDMYSIDFQEGAVAVSSELLQAEASFVRDCLNYLAAERKGRISIIAHSMGGVVASLALSMEGTPTERVGNVVALSTPFTVPPVATDVGIAMGYKAVHQFWAGKKAQSIFLLSFAGGIRDLTVPSHTATCSPLSSAHSRHYYTPQIDSLHLELDHLATVWGLEFFAQLTKAIQILVKGRDMESIGERLEEVLGNKIGKMLYDRPSVEEGQRDMQVEVVEWNFSGKAEAGRGYRVQGGEVVLLATKPAEVYLSLATNESYRVNAISAQIETTEVSLLRLSSTDSVYIYPSSDMRIQKLHSQDTDMTWLRAMFGKYRFHIPLDSPYVFRIKPGTQFASFRYPLHITVHCESSEIKAVHVRCASEDIVKLNENDFVIYLNEICPSGPEIYLFGFDALHTYEVFVSVDWMGMLVVFALNFRMHLISSAVLFFLLEHHSFSIHIKATVLVLITTGLLLFAPALRSLGAIYPYDNVPPADPVLSLPEYLYIALVGHSLQSFISLIISYCYSLASYLSPHIPRPVFLAWVLASPAVLLYPWPYTLLSTLVSVLYDSRRRLPPKSGLLWTYATLFVSLPQVVGWIVVLFDHGVALSISPVECCTIFPLLISLLVLNLTKGDSSQTVAVAASLYVGLCSFEFPYRSLVALTAGGCVVAGVSVVTRMREERKKVE